MAFHRNGIRLASEIIEPTPGTSAQHRSGPPLRLTSKLGMASTSHRSTTGTSKQKLLKQLQSYLQRKFDGRIKHRFNIDDLQMYSVENGKGSCRIKCPICDKLIKLHYVNHERSGKLCSSWALGDVARHLNLHFK